MADPPPSNRSRAAPHPQSEREQREILVAELERRIADLEGREEADFGRFTAWDWGICLVWALALPYLALLWFRG